MQHFDVTMLHSRYSSKQISGENISVESQADALRDAGHSVKLWVRSTDELAKSRLYPLQAAMKTATRFELPFSHKPQCRSGTHILNVHNTFPNFGTRWIKDWGGPVVLTLHNYRTWCAEGSFIRDGKLCHDCLHHTSLRSVAHGCYRKSPAQTFPLAIATYRPEARSDLLRRADLVIAQNTRIFDFLMSRGLDSSRLRHVPGFAPGRPFPQSHLQNRMDRFLFVGRLTPEKGVTQLCEAWPQEFELDIIGSGPEGARAADVAGPNVRFLGQMDHDSTRRTMGSYAAVIIPSVCWEGAYPLVLREAFEQGIPVVASRGNSAADFVDANGGGVVYEPTSHESLRQATHRLRLEQVSLSREATQLAAHFFSKSNWLESMREVFESAIQARSGS